jgi:hypothetical protein
MPLLMLVLLWQDLQEGIQRTKCERYIRNIVSKNYLNVNTLKNIISETTNSTTQSKKEKFLEEAHKFVAETCNDVSHNLTNKANFINLFTKKIYSIFFKEKNDVNINDDNIKYGDIFESVLDKAIDQYLEKQSLSEKIKSALYDRACGSQKYNEKYNESPTLKKRQDLAIKLSFTIRRALMKKLENTLNSTDFVVKDTGQPIVRNWTLSKIVLDALSKNLPMGLKQLFTMAAGNPASIAYFERKIDEWIVEYSSTYLENLLKIDSFKQQMNDFSLIKYFVEEKNKTENNQKKVNVSNVNDEINIIVDEKIIETDQKNIETIEIKENNLLNENNTLNNKKNSSISDSKIWEYVKPRLAHTARSVLLEDLFDPIRKEIELKMREYSH